MKPKYHRMPLVIVGLLVAGCNDIKTGEVTAGHTPEVLCEQVKQLVDQHGSGFAQIKGSHLAASRMDIWDAKYHLVGKACQVWGWSDGKQAYMCSLTVPDEAAAIQRYDKAVSFSRQCLGDAWQAENIERIPGQAIRTIFSTSDRATVASIHRVKTQGLFKTEWTVYYFIGDRDRSL